MFITHLVLHLVVLTATVLLLARFLPSVRVKSVGAAIIVAIVFSLLNFFLGWFIRVVLFVPALFTFGLLFFFVPFIVNAVMLWLTDKLIKTFSIESVRGWLTSAAVITAVNWLLQLAMHAHQLRGQAPGQTRWI
jgi:putative membrane protein